MSRLGVAQGRLQAVRQVGRALGRTLGAEIAEGTLLETMKKSRAAKTLSFAAEPTFGELLERRAVESPEDPLLYFERQIVSHRELNRRANALAAGLSALGLVSGDNVAIFSTNCPEFVYTFFALQKLGLGVVPVNSALVGDGLHYVLQNARARAAVVHATLLPQLAAIRDRLPELEHVFVIADGHSGAGDLTTIETLLTRHGGADNPVARPDPDAVALLLYTSGTTGPPKGVVYRYRDSNTKRMRLLAHLLYQPGDVLFTCLPLFHANALLLSTVQALNAKTALALARRFSASRFWEDVTKSGATTFNALGAMIPILLKQPPGPFDRAHRVRLVVSAACPAAAWRPFEERFGVRIVEAYGAVDGGGFLTLNLGNAPVGSIGKPIGGARYRLVDDSGADVPTGATGELLVHAGGRGTRSVEYYRDRDATAEKVRAGWIHTGDLMSRDAAGFLYFAGRNTDSMRRRGENVSAFEVESVLDQHSSVLESAVFGVPSELGEDDIMAVLVPVEGHSLDPAALLEWLEGRIARHARPRFIDVVEDLPKTGTHRTQKSLLKQRGVRDQTFDAERSPPRADAERRV